MTSLLNGLVLNYEKCAPCECSTVLLAPPDAAKLLNQLKGGWRLVENHHLAKRYDFPDFETALAFTNRVGSLAEQEGHHPEIVLGWGKAEITLWTHAVNGLTLNDFVLASKISHLTDANPDEI